MSAELCPARSGEGKCCWHDTGRRNLSNPPYIVRVCCFCAQTQDVRVENVDAEGHGPFRPTKAEGAPHGPGR